MIESNKPAFNDEGESQPENKNREAKPPGIEYGDCVFVKSGMLTFKSENGDEASIFSQGENPAVYGEEDVTLHITGFTSPSSNIPLRKNRRLLFVSTER